MIKPTVIVALVLFGTSLVAEAQYDADVIDLLNPPNGASGGKRRCTVEIDRANIPCNDAWYIQFKDGSRAIQFNQVINDSPVVSLFGAQVAPDKLSVAKRLAPPGQSVHPGN